MKKIGIYGLTGCGGDQLTILNCEDQLVDIFTLCNVSSFVMAKSDNIEGNIDIAFVEGSVSTIEQKEHLLEIRKMAKILVAIGNCACYGGPQARESGTDWWERNIKSIYPKSEMEHTTAIEPMPLSYYVKVDYIIPGCPINKHEFITALTRLINDIPLDVYPIPVCAECKWNQNPCLLLENRLCLGPVTQGGCNAICPSHNIVCYGCQGPVIGANFASELSLLKDMGYSYEDIVTRMKMYGGVEASKHLKKALIKDGGEDRD